jgi:hypothetical protein
MSGLLFIAFLIVFAGGFIAGILITCQCSEKEKKDQEGKP